ncbi:hypothetical protein T439DRAFT_380491 [Meredithblackwellia eburnea MCA 4105]
MLPAEVTDILLNYVHSEPPNLTAKLRPARIALRDDPSLKRQFGPSESFWNSFASVWADHTSKLALRDHSVAESIATLAALLASLVAGEPGNQQAALFVVSTIYNLNKFQSLRPRFIRCRLTVEPHLNAVLLTGSSWSNLQDEDLLPMTRACVRSLSNLVTNNDAVSRAYFTPASLQRGPQEIFSRLLQTEDQDVLIATLVCLLNVTASSPDRIQLLCSSGRGPAILDRIMSLAQSLFERETDESFATNEFASQTFALAYALVRQIIEADAFPLALQSQAAPGFITVTAQLTMLKFLDAYLNASASTSSTSLRIVPFLLASLKSLYGALSTKGVLEDKDVPGLMALILILHCLASVGLGTKEGRTAILEGVEDVSATLKWSIEVGDKLKSVLTEQMVEPEAVHQLKRTAVQLLGIICFEQKSGQDRARECGGLVTLLGLCKIDSENITLQEHALFAIRNILHQNAENQALVAGMKAQFLVSPDGEMKDLPAKLK